MLYNLNKEMEEEVTYGELLRFMGIRLKIATKVGFQRLISGLKMKMV